MWKAVTDTVKPAAGGVFLAFEFLKFGSKLATICFFFFLLFITLQRTRAAPIKEESQQSVSRLMIAGK